MSQAAQEQTGFTTTPFMPTKKKTKLPFLQAEEGMRQLQEKIDAERMSDADFTALWADLRAQAMEKEQARTQGYTPEAAAAAARYEQAREIATAQAVQAELDEKMANPEADEDTGVALPERLSEETTVVNDLGDEALADVQLPDEPSFEEAVEHLLETITRTPRFREILVRVLGYCAEQRDLADVEEAIQGYPEYEYAAQNPYRLIRYLIDARGLELLELDEEGELVTDERKLGLTEDEIDDLVFSFALVTTPVGEQAVEELRPQRRIRELLDMFPIRFESYCDVMEFCREPKSIGQINKLFEGRDLKFLGTMNSDKTIAIQPSVFVDKLERAGAMYWDGKWKLTPEGRAFLETVRPLAG